MEHNWELKKKNCEDLREKETNRNQSEFFIGEN